jgi:HD-GYP domain-containing protein (c-di-GMP phosphodiesterase class II)
LVVAKLLEVQRLRDPGLADHARSTAEVSVAIGGTLGCDVATLDHLYLSGLLHDLGKLAISEAILWKPTGLTHAEWREIRTHSEVGHRLVSDVVHPDVADAVLYHHERVDGNGYPFGIDVRTLPVTAGVVQVADAFDTMTTGRPYQAAMPLQTALAEIERCAGTQFDPEIAAALAETCTSRGDPRIRPGAARRADVVDLTDGELSAPAHPGAPDRSEKPPSMIRLRRSG